MDEVLKSREVAARHAWLVRRWLLALRREGVVGLTGERFEVTSEPPGTRSEDLARLCARLRLPDGMAEFQRASARNLDLLLSDRITVEDLAGERVRSLVDRPDVFTGEVMDACSGLAHRVARTSGGRPRVLDLGDDPGRFLTTMTEACSSGPVDVVVSTNVLHRVPDLPLLLTRVREVLVPGGELVFVVRVGDDCASLVSSHFGYSPRPGGEVIRQGEVFPAAGWWRTALRRAGFFVGSVLCAGGSAARGQTLFRAVRM